MLNQCRDCGDWMLASLGDQCHECWMIGGNHKSTDPEDILCTWHSVPLSVAVRLAREVTPLSKQERDNEARRSPWDRYNKVRDGWSIGR